MRSRNIEFYAGTAEMPATELKGRHFDIVSMFQSLEHCRDPALAVRNAVSALDHDGLLVIDVPNMACIGFEKYGPVWWHTDAGRHLQFFTRSSLGSLLEQCGATPIRWEYQGFVTQFMRFWIDEMTLAWDAMRPKTIRPSFLHSLFYLPKALVASDDRKYEIVRVYSHRS